MTTITVTTQAELDAALVTAGADVVAEVDVYGREVTA